MKFEIETNEFENGSRLSIALSVLAFAEENGEKEEKVDVSDTVSGVSGRAPSLEIDDVNRIHGAALPFQGRVGRPKC